MSDFDKEAERERLREKYENEQEDREVTARMSELLLQGATMTNAHCSDCGDPIFRYDGQEFCPTCEKPIRRQRDAGDGSTEDGSESAGADAQESADGDHIEVARPSEEARVRFGDDAGGERGPSEEAATDPPREQATRGPPADDSELARSRAELHRRLRDLSRRAEACGDPREAEAYLSAAREAAQALAALRR